MSTAFTPASVLPNWETETKAFSIFVGEKCFSLSNSMIILFGAGGNCLEQYFWDAWWNMCIHSEDIKPSLVQLSTNRPLKHQLKVFVLVRQSTYVSSHCSQVFRNSHPSVFVISFILLWLYLSRHFLWVKQCFVESFVSQHSQTLQAFTLKQKYSTWLLQVGCILFQCSLKFMKQLNLSGPDKWLL